MFLEASKFASFGTHLDRLELSSVLFSSPQATLLLQSCELPASLEAGISLISCRVLHVEMTLYYGWPVLALDIHSPDFSHGINMFSAEEVKKNKYPAVCLLVVSPGRMSSLQRSLGLL